MDTYPVSVDVTTTDQVARWRPILNYFLVLPHAILMYLFLIAAYLLTILNWLSIIFTGKMSENNGAFVSGVLRYQWRIVCFMFAWTEEYPAFGAERGYADPGGFPAALNVTEAPAPRNRLTVFFRGAMCLPHYIALLVVGIAAGVQFLIAWFAVLFTGRWPEGMRTFCIRYERWAIRVVSYYMLLTDVYPPFGLSD